MTGDERLRLEVDAGYFASLYEVAYAKLKNSEVAKYFEDLDADYSYEKVRDDIDADSHSHSPQAHLVEYDDEVTCTEEMAAELMAAEDRAQFIKAEKDAARAEIEASRLIARMERFMDTAQVINRMAPDNEEGEK